MMADLKQSNDPKTLNPNDPAKWKGELQQIGGSKNDDFNHVIASQTINAGWHGHTSAAERDRVMNAGLA
jgi:hypothetical protein